jgi:hypothetical protein
MQHLLLLVLLGMVLGRGEGMVLGRGEGGVLVLMRV